VSILTLLSLLFSTIGWVVRLSVLAAVLTLSWVVDFLCRSDG